MPRHKWFSVQASDGDSQSVSVAVRGYIGEWGLNDRQFIAELESALAASGAREVRVAINSRGGEVDHAIAIFNHLRALKEQGVRVTVRIDGIAASAASIIAMAGDEIVMPANALMMVHAPWTWAAGNAEQLRREADTLDKFESALIETYMARTGRSLDEIKALLAEDTWMTAQEAVDMGFADRVEPLAADTSASATLTMALAEACAVPHEVLARAQTPIKPSQPAAHQAAAEQEAAQVSARLLRELRTLCDAARMPALAEALLPFAQASGIEAARAVLAQSAAQPPADIDPTVPSSASDQASAHSHSASQTLARLALRAINPRARV